jgi:hypothetical protein
MGPVRPAGCRPGQPSWLQSERAQWLWGAAGRWCRGGHVLSSVGPVEAVEQVVQRPSL